MKGELAQLLIKDKIKEMKVIKKRHYKSNEYINLSVTNICSTTFLTSSLVYYINDSSSLESTIMLFGSLSLFIIYQISAKMDSTKVRNKINECNKYIKYLKMLDKDISNKNNIFKDTKGYNFYNELEDSYNDYIEKGNTIDSDLCMFNPEELENTNSKKR